MQYKVIVFNKGDIRIREKLEASSPLLAAKVSKKPSVWTHIMVIGKQIKRFSGKKYVPMTNVPVLAKVYWKGKIPSIVAIYGTIPEFYRFETEEERNKIYEEMQKCITSTSAESAKVGAALTDIIASLDEISGTKSISTSRKISNGSVMSAICSVSRTLENTAKSSGTGKSGDMATNTWFGGLKGFRLEQGQTFLATVKTLPSEQSYEYPGINSSMKEMEGKTYKFKFTHKSNNINYYKSVSPNWMWSEKWITPEVITAKVTEIPVGTTFKASNGAKVTYDANWAGKTLTLDFCTCGCGCYKHSPTDSYFKPEWLDVSHE